VDFNAGIESGGNMKIYSRCIAAGSVLLALGSSALAQAEGLTRTIVAKGDVSVANREGVVAKVEIIAGGSAGWHTHPGDEITYVADGEVTLLLAGQAPRKVVAGEGFVIPAGTVHNAKNDGPGVTRLVGIYVVDKGKPLASPAPQPDK
jgi:quercetin dioxygenase-like cupin family protein